MDNKTNSRYETPEAIILDMICEGILCESLKENDGNWGH